MTQTAKIVISATDKATNVLDNIKDKLGGIGTAAKGMIALFAFDKLKEFFTKMVEVGGKASADLTKNVDSIKDGLNGYMAELAKTVLGNQDLIDSIKSLISAIFPLINVLFKALIPIFTSLVNIIMKVRDAIKPLVEIVLGVLIPAFQKTVMVLQIAANSFLILKNMITGNWKEVSRLREENKKLQDELLNGAFFIKVDLSSGDFKAAEALGKKLRESVDKGAKSVALPSIVALPKPKFDAVNTTVSPKRTITPILSTAIGIPEKAKEVQQKYLDSQREFYERQKELAAQFIDEFGGVVQEGFARIFSGDLVGGIKAFFGSAIGSIAEGFKAFTMQWMKSQGVFLMFQAKIYAVYGKLLSGLAKFLGNPFTAGFAALGIAAGISALSRSLGGSGGSSANAGTGFNPNIGAASVQNNVAGNGTGDATIVIQGGLLDMSNPEQARSLANALQTLSGRRIILQGV